MFNVIYILTILSSTQALYIPQTQQNESPARCKPNNLYASENITCICSQIGSWPHKDCQKVFGHLRKTEDTSECAPDGYAIIECNVCRCTTKGEIDHSQCTRNVCDEEAKNITNNKDYRRTDGVIGTCVANQWYSMAPCQYCYCANKNKLLCNTGGVSKSELKLGSYKLSVCETNLQQDINALYPKSLREGNVDEVKETTTEGGETQTDDALDEDSVPKIDEDEKDDDESRTDKSSTKAVIAKASKKNNKKAKITKKDKKILRKETLGTEKPERTTTIQITRMKDASYEIENSASNDQIDVGLNLDLGQPSPEDDQIPDEAQEKLELGETIYGNDEKEKSEALQDAQNYIEKPNTFSEILDKFIHLAIRKSMMTLKPGKSCVPGSQVPQGCNICFCLKNGKNLCTNKVC